MLTYEIIPCYKSIDTALKVVHQCLPCVDKVICGDDSCPYNTDKVIQQRLNNSDAIDVVILLRSITMLLPCFVGLIFLIINNRLLSVGVEQHK